MIRFVAMGPELFGLLVAPVGWTGSNILELPEVQEAVCAPPNTAVAMLEDGAVLAAAGVQRIWPGRAVAWFQPGAAMGLRHYALARRRCAAELARLGANGVRRIECAVQADAPGRCNWVRQLGFVQEGRMRGFGPDGADHVLLARVTG